jgi:hypothetical protein
MPLAPQVTNTPNEVFPVTFAISAVTYTSTSATYTATGHTFSIGDFIAITDITPDGYNGFYIITAVVVGVSVTVANTTNAAVTTAVGTLYHAATGFNLSSTYVVYPSDVTNTGAIGPAGPTGATGPAGPAGGAVIITGSGLPTPAVGSNGNFYINTTTNLIYGPKASGVWLTTIAGYYAGGFNGANFLSGIDKITFATDTKSTLAAVVSVPKYAGAGLANSGTAGYYAGGYGGGGVTYTNIVDKIAFPGDVKTTLAATLTLTVDFCSGISNVQIAGYVAAGYYSSGNANIDKFDFNTDAKSTVVAALTSTRYDLCGISNTGVAGYFGGGIGVSVSLSGIDKITFASDTKSTLAATLSTPRSAIAGIHNPTVAGYFAGGYDSSNISAIDRIDFGTDAKTTLAATLSVAKNSSDGITNLGVAGYIGGGWDNSSTYYTGIDKITFPAETKNTLTATLTSGRRGIVGF